MAAVSDATAVNDVAAAGLMAFMRTREAEEWSKTSRFSESRYPAQIGLTKRMAEPCRDTCEHFEVTCSMIIEELQESEKERAKPHVAPPGATMTRRDRSAALKKCTEMARLNEGVWRDLKNVVRKVKSAHTEKRSADVTSNLQQLRVFNMISSLDRNTLVNLLMPHFKDLKVVGEWLISSEYFGKCGASA
jgi:hypothetical protein